MVDGQIETLKAQETAQNLFDKGQIETDNMPTEIIKKVGEVNILDFLSSLSIIKSKSEARRLIEQGGITINNKKQQSTDDTIQLNKNQKLIIKKGKKTFLKVIIA